MNTGGKKQEAISFDSCLTLAKTFVADDIASLKLAGHLLEQRAAAAVKAAEQAVKAAEQAAKAAEQMASSEEHQRKTVEDFRTKEEKLWKDKEKYLNMEALRAKGLLSSRGIFERFLQLAYSENVGSGNIKGKFFATQVCANLDTLQGDFHSLHLRTPFDLLKKTCWQENGLTS